MSTHDPINDHFDDPFGGSSGELVTRIERELCHSRPIVNDLNRSLTDLLGPCPVTADGHWVTLVVSDENPDGDVAFPQLPMHEALRLSTALAHIDAEVDLNDIRQSLPQSRKYEVHVLPLHMATDPGAARTSGLGSRFHGKAL